MSKRFYSSVTGTEPNMRQEMNNFLDGTFQEVPKKQPTLLRRMRRGTLELYPEPQEIEAPWIEWNSAGKRYRWHENSGTNLLPCACIDSVTKEADKDQYCAFCQGDGFIWDEIFIDAYKVVIKSDVGNALLETSMNPGLIREPVVIFYTRSSVLITPQDKIVELVLTTAGEPTTPGRRRKLYRIGIDVDLRADNAKLEYWKLDCYAEYRKFLNGPGDI